MLLSIRSQVVVENGPLIFRRKENMNQQVSEAVRHGCIALSRAYFNGTRNPRLKPRAIAVSSLTGRPGCFFCPVAARPAPGQAPAPPKPAPTRARPGQAQARGRAGRAATTISRSFREACRDAAKCRNSRPWTEELGRSGSSGGLTRLLFAVYSPPVCRLCTTDSLYEKSSWK